MPALRSGAATTPANSHAGFLVQYTSSAPVPVAYDDVEYQNSAASAFASSADSATSSAASALARCAGVRGPMIAASTCGWWSSQASDSASIVAPRGRAAAGRAARAAEKRPDG